MRPDRDDLTARTAVDHSVLIRWSPALKRSTVVLAAIFVALVASGIHGFSLPLWHQILDGSSAPEVLLGEARQLRSDDWNVYLPMAFSQRAQEPAFPVVNESIGLGQNMLVPFPPVPVAHPLTLFRPSSWGFLLGDDTGMAWMWWSRALGLFLVWMLVFMMLTRNRLGLSSSGALLLVLSPYLQFWSLNSAPQIAFSGLIFVSAAYLAFARTWRLALASGLALGWSAGCFVLVLYPPHQVALALVVAALLLAFLWERRRELHLHQPGRRIAGAMLALLIVSAVALLLFADAGDGIARLAGSVYPGGRRDSGGNLPFWMILNANLALPLRVDDWTPLRNICEAASFWLLFPVVTAGWAWRYLTDDRHADPVAVAMLACIGIILLYQEVGFPDDLARMTLFDRTTPRRTVIGLGLADLILLLRFLAARPRSGAGNAWPMVVAVGWATAMLGCGILFDAAFPELDPRWSIAAAILNGLLAFLVLRQRRGALVVTAMAAALGVSTLWFNPVVEGGAGYLRENALSQKILAADRAAGGESRWLVSGPSPVSNLFRILGVQCITGSLPVPQLELWERLDPDGKYEHVYNRFGYATVTPVGNSGASFRLVSELWYSVLMDPAGTAARTLGVTHVMIEAKRPTEPTSSGRLEHLFSEDSFHAFRIREAR